MTDHKKLVNDELNVDAGTLPRSVANPVRTAVQMAPSIAITEFVDAFFVNLNEQQYTALAAILLLAFGFAQNLYEGLKGKAFLK